MPLTGPPVNRKRGRPKSNRPSKIYLSADERRTVQMFLGARMAASENCLREIAPALGGHSDDWVEPLVEFHNRQLAVLRWLAGTLTHHLGTLPPDA